MDWMDRARTVGGLLWLVGGLAFQGGWLVLEDVVPGPVTLVLVAATCALGLLVVARPGSAGVWLAGWVLAVLLALDLAGAVMDRFGVLGAPGEDGVSWGSWTAFEDYTATLLHHPGDAIVLVAAVGATAIEVLLAALLAIGWQRRWVGKALAGLFAVYLVAMAASVGWAEVARYAVPVLVAGALLVSACPVRRDEPASAPAVRTGGAIYP